MFDFHLIYLCIYLVFVCISARWNDENCGMNRGYVCKKPVTGTVVIPSPSPYPPGGCANGFTRVPGGSKKELTQLLSKGN